MIKRLHPLIFFIIITIPFVLWAKVQILPTFDDWSTLSSPNTDSDFLPYFMRYGNVWRPFDALMGYIVGFNPRLFPVLNHIVIFLGHLLGTFMVFLLCAKAYFNRHAQAIATTFFYLSPCVLGTVLACDSLNQVYSQLWGLVAIWCYLHYSGTRKYVLWALCVFLAALSKENGIAWAIVPPIFAWGIQGKQTDGIRINNFPFKEIGWGILIAITYFIIRMLIPKTEIFNPDYETFNIMKNVKGLVIWLGYTWFSADYICLVHEPSRNIPLFVITLLLSLPFVYILFIRNYKLWKHRTFLALTACAVIAVSPNLLISLTVMNAYASLGMFAILVGFIINEMVVHSKASTFREIWWGFSLYILSALIVGFHHWKASYDSSIIGKEMAQSVLRQMTKPVDKAYCIVIEDDYPKFSSFCEKPSYAFGWGTAVRYENEYQWPKELNDTTIDYIINTQQITELTQQAFQKGYQCVWIVEGKDVKVVEK